MDAVADINNILVVKIVKKNVKKIAAKKNLMDVFVEDVKLFIRWPNRMIKMMVKFYVGDAKLELHQNSGTMGQGLLKEEHPS